MFSLPVQEALAVFSGAAPRVRRHARFIRYAREAIGIPESEIDAWYTQAWWGTSAANACGNRLAAPKRAQEVIDLVAPVDWSPLDALLARGQGVLLCTAHWGVPYIATALLSSMGRVPLQVGVWLTRLHRPETDLSHAGTPSGLTRLYLQAFLHLRAGGIVSIVPDGKRWRVGVEERFFGHPCQVSIAPAALARLTGAPALPCMAVWDENRIRIEFGAAIEPETGEGEPADRRWTRKHLDWLEAVVRANPRITRLDQLLPTVTLPPEPTHVAG